MVAWVVLGGFVRTKDEGRRTIVAGAEDFVLGPSSMESRESSVESRPWSGDSWRFVGNMDDIVRRWSGKSGNGQDCDV